MARVNNWAMLAVVAISLLAAAPGQGKAVETFVNVQCPAFAPPQGIVVNVTSAIDGTPYASANRIGVQVSYANGTMIQILVASPSDCNSQGTCQYPAYVPTASNTYNFTAYMIDGTSLISGSCLTTMAYFKPNKAVTIVPELNFPLAAVAGCLGVLAFSRVRRAKALSRKRTG
jgi:hypothetical protein